MRIYIYQNEEIYKEVLNCTELLAFESEDINTVPWIITTKDTEIKGILFYKGNIENEESITKIAFIGLIEQE